MTSKFIESNTWRKRFVCVLSKMLFFCLKVSWPEVWGRFTGEDSCWYEAVVKCKTVHFVSPTCFVFLMVAKVTDLMYFKFIVCLTSLISDSDLIIIMYTICLGSVVLLTQSHHLASWSHIISLLVTCHLCYSCQLSPDDLVSRLCSVSSHVPHVYTPLVTNMSHLY